MAVSHRFQRDWLHRGLFAGPVTVNGRWPGQPQHVYTFDNPSLTLQDVEQARGAVLGKRLERPVRMLFVGRTAAAKGLGVVLQAVRDLLVGEEGASGLELSLDVLGDGSERATFERQSHELGLDGVVRFHGWVGHTDVYAHLRDAHLVLLPSQTEGWPKVLSEAMAFGVVPVSSQVSAIPQVLAETGTGMALPPGNVRGYVQAIRQLVGEPALWRQMVEAGLRAAPRFTYERYLLRLDEMLRGVYGESGFDRRLTDELSAQWAVATAEAQGALDRLSSE
jgi:glycosyltransferase involved in cell wall biosynthesis